MIKAIVVLHEYKGFEITDDFSVGWETFKSANDFRVDEGSLMIFNNRTGNAIQVFAPGVWKEVYVLRSEDDEE